MEIKIALDMEIAAYSKLLQGEETRLGLSPTGSPEVVAAAPPRGVKRKRTIVEEEEVFDMVSEHAGPGNVVIEPLKKGAKLIRIFNKSFEEGEQSESIESMELKNPAIKIDFSFSAKTNKMTTL